MSHGLRILAVAFFLVASEATLASTTGADFKSFYDWIFDAANGYLGRGIAVTAGLIGMAIGAGMGKILPAVVGVMLAIVGSIGPGIINSLFASALI